jgi:hypothetical protein
MARPRQQPSFRRNFISGNQQKLNGINKIFKGATRERYCNQMIGDKLYIQDEEDNRLSLCTYTQLCQDTSLQCSRRCAQPTHNATSQVVLPAFTPVRPDLQVPASQLNDPTPHNICDTPPQGTPPKLVPLESYNVEYSKNLTLDLAERKQGQETRPRFKSSESR